jgi:hypothetical protein
LKEKVRRRAYLVRMRTRMKNKIRMQLLYEGVKNPEFDIFTRKGVEWLHSLNMDSVESYLPVMSVLSEQGGEALEGAQDDRSRRRGREAPDDHTWRRLLLRPPHQERGSVYAGIPSDREVTNTI